jgi:integrase
MPDYILRSITSTGTINGSLSPAAVRDIVRRYGAAIGIPDLQPHDLRRTHARLARNAGCPLETIQATLGHASVRTTEVYTRTGLEANAGDWIGFE